LKKIRIEYDKRGVQTTSAGLALRSALNEANNFKNNHFNTLIKTELDVKSIDLESTRK
jgi:hypothetical protein